MKQYIKPKNIENHYTKKEMVENLLKHIDYDKTTTFLDSGSGKNKVWFNCLDVKEKYECEIEDGQDFYEFDKQVDWVVGNPPFSHAKDFLLKAKDIAKIGIAFLVNNQCFNSFLLPSRLEVMSKSGFNVSKIKVVNDKRWFGRYYFIIFQKKPDNFIEWELKVFQVAKIKKIRIFERGGEGKLFNKSFPLVIL